MAENSKIEWTDHTFNPWTGCTKVSPGCDGCYAEAWAKRSGTVRWGAGEPRRRTTEANWRLPLKWNAQARREGRRYRVFCASLADVFDNAAPWQWRLDLFGLIHDTPHLDWLLLTKRIGNVPSMLTEMQVHGSLAAVFPNVWLGATVVNQAEADRDIPKLLAVPARVRFLSIEPMLEAIDLHDHLVRGHNGFTSMLGWVIAGGESGPHSRPAHPDWFRSLRDQCAAAGVPFHFKQWGEFAPTDTSATAFSHPRPNEAGELIAAAEGQFSTYPAGEFVTVMRRFGKRWTGRLLDGVEHNGFPT